jgi:hypothetical protein
MADRSDETTEVLIHPSEESMPANFRILSLDGGGLLGTFTACVLAELEDDLKKRSGYQSFRLVDHFDLITGTSTGGILAIGLAMGVPARQLLSFYQEKGPTIFPPLGRIGGFCRFLRNMFRPKFDPGPLETAVREVFGEARLRNAQTRLAVPAYRGTPGQVYLFKTPHNALWQLDSDTLAVDAALATAAAPTYFPAHTLPNHGGTFIDGGVWANGPTTVGIAEAVAFCGQPLTNVDMLSIGTTTTPFEITAWGLNGGYLAWARQAITTFMFGQSHGSILMAESLLGDRFVRIDANTRTPIAMDDPSKIDHLIQLGLAALNPKVLGKVKTRFLNGQTVTPWFAAPSVPPPTTSRVSLPPPPAPPTPSPPPTAEPVSVAPPRPAVLHPAPPAYRQRLVVYVVWHPNFKYGRVVADALHTHLNRPPEHPEGGGLGIPVLFRSALWRGESLPDPIPFDEAQNTAVVVLVDDHMTSADGWRGYVEGVWEGAQAAGGTHRVYPVKMSERAFFLSPQISRLNFIRPYDVADPPGSADAAGARTLPENATQGSEAAALTRLLNAVLHELCRLVMSRPRTDYETPIALPAEQKLTIFLSHTKADGVPIAQAIKRYIQDETHLATFFDANDIDHGDEFDQVLMDRVGRDDAALLVIHTDAYSGSVWCLEELLRAKERRRPVLVVHAIGVGEARGPVYVGNVPTRQYGPGKYAQLVGRMLLEILRCEHFVRHFEDLKKLFKMDSAIEPLPYPPEPLTLADLKLTPDRTATRFAYPEPPLSQGELKRLQALDERFTFNTPLLLATRAWDGRPEPNPTDPVPRLRGKEVGLSLGNSPDLAPSGMGDDHLNEAAIAFARYLLVCGADVSYGGIPKLDAPVGAAPPPNFLLLLLGLVRAYNRRATGDPPRPRLRSYIPEAFAGQVDATFLASWKGAIVHEIVPSGAATPTADPVDRAVCTAHSLTAMRRRMTERTDARVFLGGRSFGFAGKYPGLVEEAHFAMAKPQPQPVYLIGAFGGATRGVIDALFGNLNPVLSWEEQRRDPAYAALGERCRTNSADPADPLGYGELAAFFRGVGVEGLSRPGGPNYNGLTEAENHRLFVTPHVIEMVYLVLLGLGRLYGQNRG